MLSLPRYEVAPRLERSFQAGFHGTQLFFSDDRIGQACPVQVCSAQVRRHDIRSAQVGAGEIGIGEMKSVRHDVPSKDTLVCLHLRKCTNHTSDRFVRYTKVICNSTKRFFLLKYTLRHSRPVFSGNTVFGVF
jgi:hypothetical protein